MYIFCFSEILNFRDNFNGKFRRLCRNNTTELDLKGGGRTQDNSPAGKKSWQNTHVSWVGQSQEGN